MVKVNKDQFIFSWGKQPKGLGMWAFEINGREVFIKGLYADARKEAIKMAKILCPTAHEIKLLS